MSRLISNVKKELKPIILQAAKETGLPIEVRDRAYCGGPGNEQELPTFIGVWLLDPTIDTEKFWRRVAELRKEAETTHDREPGRAQ